MPAFGAVRLAVLTVVVLAAAMAPGVTERQLAALDDRFTRVPEDLAVHDAASRAACMMPPP